MTAKGWPGERVYRGKLRPVLLLRSCKYGLWLQPIDSWSGNGRHAIAIAPDLIRIEMLRIGRTYELAISKHSLGDNGSRVRLVITSTLLFRGNEGTLAIELWHPENKRLRG